MLMISIFSQLSAYYFGDIIVTGKSKHYKQISTESYRKSTHGMLHSDNQNDNMEL